MEIKNKDLKKRIIEISYKNKLSHIGSCLTAVDIIEEIYSIKKPDEKFVLSSGHAGLALYVVLEKYTDKNAEDIWLHHGVHPDRCNECGIDCSAGSLGHGLPIAVGMALADHNKNVYVLCSDGELAEGSTYEAMNIMEDKGLLYKNLHLYINSNGWAAYRETFVQDFWADALMINIWKTNVNDFSFLKGQDAHYHVLNESEYNEAMEVLK